ncbi:MAG: PilZ domain-containing protein [Planctomycetota bacterium]
MNHSDNEIGQLERRRAPRRTPETRGVLVWFRTEGDTWQEAHPAELLDLSEVGIAFCLPGHSIEAVPVGTSCRLELGRDPEHRIRFEGPIVRCIDGDRLAYAFEIEKVEEL